MAAKRVGPSFSRVNPDTIICLSTGEFDLNTLRVDGEFFTALFNNMRTLKFKGRPANVFFAAVNQMFGGSSQLTTTAEHFFVV